MPSNIELLVAIGLPVAILTFLRINAAMVFLSLCLGRVLVEYVGPEANSFISLVAPKASAMSNSTLQLLLLLLPAGLTSFFMLLSVKGRLKVVLNVLPAASVGTLMVLLLVPLLPPDIRQSLQAQPLWHQLEKLQPLLIGAGAVVSLALLWLQRSKGDKEKDKKHKH